MWTASSEEEDAPRASAAPQQLIQGLQPPTGLKIAGKNKAANWKADKQSWENYAIIAKLYKQTEDFRVT